MANVGPTSWYLFGGPAGFIADAFTTSGASGATLAAANAIDIPAGVLLIVSVVEAGATASGTFSDGGFNTYTVAASQALGASAGFMTVFYAWNTTARVSASLTYTRQNSGAQASFTVLWSPTGKTSGDPLDTGFTVKASGTTSSPSITSNAPAGADQMVLGLAGWAAGSSLTYSQPASSALQAPPLATTSQLNAQQAGGQQMNNTPDTVVFNPTLSGTPTGNATILLSFKTNITTGGYWAISPWASLAVVTAGTIRRQRKQPVIGNERAFVAIVTGATGAAEPTWVITKGAKTTDGTVTWQEVTGQPGVNGDTVGSPTWLQNKNTAVTLGLITYDSVSGSLQIVSTAGTTGNGSQPSFSATAGVTTSDNTVTWTSLGAASSFVAWSTPFARRTAVYGTGWALAGDTTWIRATHQDIQGSSILVNHLGTPANPTKEYVVNYSSLPPTISDLVSSPTVQVGTCGTSNSANVVSNTTTGLGLISQGLIFVNYGAGSCSLGGNGLGVFRLRNCQFSAQTIQRSSLVFNMSLANSGSGADVEFDNCSFAFSSAAMAGGAAGIAVTGGGRLRFKGGQLVAGSNLPTTLFLFNSSAKTTMTQFVGVDFSNYGSGKTLLAASAVPSTVQFLQCKLGASVTLAAAATGYSPRWEFIDCDSTGSQFNNALVEYGATLTTETTVILTSGAATDGTTSISWRVTTTANNNRFVPFTGFTYSEYIDTVGSPITRTFEVLNDGLTLTNAEVWIEYSYKGTSGSTLTTVTQTAPTELLTTPTSLTTSTAGWTTTGLTTPIAQKIAITFTPQVRGEFRATLKVGRASKTIFFNPRANEV